MNEGLYDFARMSFRAIFGTIWRLRVFGADRVPHGGPLIVACNHRSYLDPPVLGAACPRRISYMAKSELFAIPALGPIIRAVGAYPVEREGSARSAIKRSIEVLAGGGCIGIFPEGTRNRRGEASAQTGVALLAALAQAPVVPARLTGTDRATALAPMRAYFGEPMRLPQGRKATREEMSNFTLQVMRAIDSLPEQFHSTTGV